MANLSGLLPTIQELAYLLLFTFFKKKKEGKLNMGQARLILNCNNFINFTKCLSHVKRCPKYNYICSILNNKLSVEELLPSTPQVLPRREGTKHCSMNFPRDYFNLFKQLEIRLIPRLILDYLLS